MMEDLLVPGSDDIIHEVARDAHGLIVRELGQIDLFIILLSLAVTDSEISVVQFELLSSIDRDTESESEI